jgi:hypothetical protein
VTMVYWYNYHNSGHYPSSCLLFKTQLNSVGLSVPHRKHITTPLRAQQVNAIYRFVTMVYWYNYHNSGHYPSSCVLFKTQLNSVGLRLRYEPSRLMLSIGLWRWCINLTITILDIIFYLIIFCLKQSFWDWILSLSSGGTYSVGPNR